MNNDGLTNKIVHRFIRKRSDYMTNEGVYYNQIIPLGVQAYSIEFDQNYPEDYSKANLFYVIGTGTNTYKEIVEGKGKYSDGTSALSKEFRVISTDDYSDLQLPDILPEDIDKVLSNDGTNTYWASISIDGGNDDNIDW